MTLPRTLEPEVMDSEQEASDYDAMDHAEVNARFCQDLLAAQALPRGAHVLDVGTGTALIPIELCRRVPADGRVCVDAIDLSESMLAIARRNVKASALAERIRIHRGDGRSTLWGTYAFDVVMSNSAMHHVARPTELLHEMWRLLRDGGALFVRDLARPHSSARVRELAAQYAPIPGGLNPRAQAMHERQRALLEASLHAALTVTELVSIVTPLGIPAEAVRQTSDRHWTLAYTKR